jgi:tellurite resistance protein TerC
MLLAAAADELDLNLSHQWYHWAIFLGLVVVLLLLDVLVLHKDDHVASFRRAAIESACWISVGLLFGLLVVYWFGGDAGSQYYAGYLIEKSLSVDNVFVWALILSYFAVPAEYQHRVLFWGIFGALVMRAIFVFAGVAIIERFSWVLYIFGAFLIYTAVKLVISKDEEADPSKSKFLQLFKRFVPTTDELHGHNLFTRINGKRMATPLMSVLVLVEATDVVFAVDSVPAVLAVSRDQFIVLSSNAFAIMGLRALYFLLADLHDRFEYLKYGLAVILAFVGVKMLIAEWYHIPTGISLGFIAITLAVSIIWSIRHAGKSKALALD